MTQDQFNKAEAQWAHGILAQPAHTMPNGRDSHDVATEVLEAIYIREAGTGNYYADGRRVDTHTF